MGVERIEPQPEPWMRELKRLVAAGRYKTEEALGQQERFPWQDKRCRDCPFWLDTSWCQVFSGDRNEVEHTCSYFDVSSRPAGQAIVDERLKQSRRRFLEWLWGER